MLMEVNSLLMNGHQIVLVIRYDWLLWRYCGMFLNGIIAPLTFIFSILVMPIEV
jgi:hypothetical protein